jgi:hypothetical protein
MTDQLHKSLHDERIKDVAMRVLRGRPVADEELRVLAKAVLPESPMKPPPEPKKAAKKSASPSKKAVIKKTGGRK